MPSTSAEPIYPSPPPFLVDELSARGLPHPDAIVRIGQISSLGVLAYALGKFFLGGLGDFWGGRRNFLIGLGGATAFTLMFAAGGVMPVFMIAWLGNRLTQSIAWAGLIKVTSKCSTTPRTAPSSEF